MVPGPEFTSMFRYECEAASLLEPTPTLSSAPSPPSLTSPPLVPPHWWISSGSKGNKISLPVGDSALFPPTKLAISQLRTIALPFLGGGVVLFGRGDLVGCSYTCLSYGGSLSNKH